jgi:hypothetical protein
MASPDALEVVNIKAEADIDIKEENVPEHTAFPVIQTEPEVRLGHCFVCVCTHMCICVRMCVRVCQVVGHCVWDHIYFVKSGRGRIDSFQVATLKTQINERKYTGHC